MRVRLKVMFEMTLALTLRVSGGCPLPRAYRNSESGKILILLHSIPATFSSKYIVHNIKTIVTFYVMGNVPQPLLHSEHKL